MPELPEVETTRCGIAPYIEQKCFKAVNIRQAQLRWPVPDLLTTILPDLKLEKVERRAKFLLLRTRQGTLLIHLGMSGNLRICSLQDTVAKHDHVDFIFADDIVLRYNDQRKFGAILWWAGDINQHPLLEKLGPEPLCNEFNAEYLFLKAKKRNLAVKSLIMDSHIVVGVGNIYANESLFMAGIRPDRAAGSVSQLEYEKIVIAIKTILAQAIEKGGTTLRDFLNAQGKPGYFQQSLNVYGRANQNCKSCNQPIQLIRLGQRSTFFCINCQY